MGDNKETSLGNVRAIKSDPIFNAVGDIDELNTKIGTLIALLGKSKNEYFINPDGSRLQLKDALSSIQSDLFSIGADIASSANNVFIPKRRIGKDDVKRLESYADLMSASFPALASFVLPGGCIESAAADEARAVARRAERSVVNAANSFKIENTEILAYLNRLSSVLFVAARFINNANGVRETPPNY
ncbi:cob(I)yrinic acid a,c-diamide adenosyltransferase [Candidatus Marsarchaeota archaeon]|nr:cob(I)yrinic acid a,c-diamide adenosyltransferase [Candidatus Marsarchaeota archaeon]